MPFFRKLSNYLLSASILSLHYRVTLLIFYSAYYVVSRSILYFCLLRLSRLSSTWCLILLYLKFQCYFSYSMSYLPTGFYSSYGMICFIIAVNTVQSFLSAFCSLKSSIYLVSNFLFLVSNTLFSFCWFFNSVRVSYKESTISFYTWPFDDDVCMVGY